MDYSLTVKVFFLQPRYFSYSQGIFLKGKVFFLYPRYFSFHCTFTSLGRFVSLTVAGPRRSHRSRTEGWPAISNSCDWDMPLSLQMKKLNFRNMPLNWSEFVWFSWGTPTNPHYKPQTLKVRIETNPTGTTGERTCQFQYSEKNRVPDMGGNGQKKNRVQKLLDSVFQHNFSPLSGTLFFSEHSNWQVLSPALPEIFQDQGSGYSQRVSSGRLYGVSPDQIPSKCWGWSNIVRNSIYELFLKIVFSVLSLGKACLASYICLARASCWK